ncbi:hypothetical protein AB5J55_00110 [Streptomyces sp. R11]|uniref:Uncharacterized protein n=1 Tax=Streptomyces sp. R11 TaxID=3238625 RepID=A0AB39MPD0_9ACTN
MGATTAPRRETPSCASCDTRTGALSCCPAGRGGAVCVGGIYGIRGGSLHEWKLNHLPPDTRPLPSVIRYDQLLRHRRTGGGDLREGEAP